MLSAGAESVTPFLHEHLADLLEHRDSGMEIANPVIHESSIPMPGGFPLSAIPARGAGGLGAGLGLGGSTARVVLNSAKTHGQRVCPAGQTRVEPAPGNQGAGRRVAGVRARGGRARGRRTPRRSSTSQMTPVTQLASSESGNAMELRQRRAAHRRRRLRPLTRTGLWPGSRCRSRTRGAI